MQTVCPHCNAPLRHPNAAFCGTCGRSLTPAPSPPPPPPGGGPQPSGTQLLQPSQLIIRWPGGQSQTAPLLKDMLTVGREPGNDLTVNFSTVSRQHLRLEKRGGTYHVIDLGSRNGTTLNGQRLMANMAYPLSHSAVLRIGDDAGNSVSLTYQESGTALGPTMTRQLALAGRTQTVLGRDPACDVPLQAPSVSWHHARIGQTPQGATLRDLGSTNGTFVNGKRVGSHPLQAGDRIQIGPFVLAYQPSQLTSFGGTDDFSLDGIQLRREVPAKGGATKVILDNVSISVQPREFVALVGGSGAGKSTLMNALCGFKKASAGQVLVNGEDLYANYGRYRTQLGYVPQDDIIHQGLPVARALRYAARLRLPADTKPKDVQARVDEVLLRVGLAGQKGQLVSSLSGGQRKRVSIGSELLVKPGLFFLDEPTSGLDPGLEKRMMATMRDLSDEGRTVVLVTHATANITLCDLVAFMSQGYLVFYGPPDDAKQFFGAMEFADIYAQLEPAPTPQTPTPDLKAIAKQWEARFRTHPCYQQYVAGRQGGGHHGPGRPPPGPVTPPLGPSGKAGQAAGGRGSPLRQFLLQAQRYAELITRDRMSLFVLLAVMPIIALLLLLTGKPADLVGNSAAEISRELAKGGNYLVAARAQSLLLMMALASVLLGLFGAAYEVVKEWSVYRRERMVNLGILPYLGSKVAVLMAFALLQCLLLLLVVSFKIDLPTEGLLLSAPAEMYVTLLLAALASIGMGLFISSISRSQNMVIYIILILLFLQIIFSGALFDLPSAAKPISYATVTRWAMEGLGASVNMEYLSGLDTIKVKIPADPALGLPEQEKEVKNQTSFRIDYTREEGHLLSRWAILLGFGLFWAGLAGVVLKRRDELK
jgi:ABC-type multidrug transport system ATPase subunit/pSer/pThr/pTyr-binding forkhead associated (FHA) protein